MCEFKVVKDGKTVFEDAVYAEMQGNHVVVKDVLGASKQFENCKIVEVDANSNQLALSTC